MDTEKNSVIFLRQDMHRHFVPPATQKFGPTMLLKDINFTKKETAYVIQTPIRRNMETLIETDRRYN